MNDQVSAQETDKILSLAKQCLGLEGNFVEFGCYRGDTTVLLAKMLGQTTRLYAYDSFSGLPEKTSQDLSGAGQNFQAGELSVSKHEVITKLKRANLHNVIIKKAWFKDLTPEDLPEKISFAFIDGDFYESQRDALKLVVPKLVKQGIIICHDYNNPELPGASKAVDEFLATHPNFHLSIYQTLATMVQY